MTVKSLKNVCVWNFAANMIKILQRHFNCLTKHQAYGEGCMGWGGKQNIMDESVKNQGVVGCVFWFKRHCPSWICTIWSGGKQTAVPGSFSVFEGCCGQEKAWIVGKPDLDVAPWQCASSHLVPYPQLPGKTSRQPLYPIHLILRT